MKREHILSFDYSDIYKKQFNIMEYIRNIDEDSIVNVKITNKRYLSNQEQSNERQKLKNYDPDEPVSLQLGFYQVERNDDVEKVSKDEDKTERTNIKCILCNQSISIRDEFKLHNNSIHHYLKYAEDFCKMRKIAESIKKMKQCWWKVSAKTVYQLLLPISEKIVRIQFEDEIVLEIEQDVLEEAMVKGYNGNILSVFVALLETWISLETMEGNAFAKGGVVEEPLFLV